MRKLSILFLAVFFQYTCGNAVNPVFAPLAARTGMSVVQTGLFFTLSSLVWLIASPFWGRQSERRGRTNVMFIGLVSCFILYALFGIVANWGLTHHPSPMVLFVLLLLIRIASGFFFSTVPVAAQAYIADTTSGMERTRSISLVWMASGLGSIVGPSLSLLSKANLMTPLYIGAILPLLGGILVMTHLPRSQVKRMDGSLKSASRISPFDRRVWRMLATVSALQASVLAIQVTSGFLIQREFHVSSTQAAQRIGLLFTITGIVSVATQWVFARRLRFSSAWLLRVGRPFLLLCAVFLLFHTHFAALVAAFGALGFGIGCVLPGATSAASLAVRADEQGAVAGRISAAQGLGTALGPLVGTVLYDQNTTLPAIFVGILFSGLMMV